MTTALTTRFGIRDARAVFARLDVDPATRADYACPVRTFLVFAKRQTASGVNVNDVFQLFKDALRGKVERRKMALATANKKLIAARQFLKELHRQGFLLLDVTATVKTFAQGRMHKRQPFTETEMDAIMEAATKTDARTQAILTLLAVQGFRTCEVVRLAVEDLDLAARIALVHGKSRDDREPVNLQSETCRALRAYLAETCLTSGPLFPGRRRGRPLTTKGIRDLLNPVLERAGVTGKTAHNFRHTFATNVVSECKGDLLAAKRLTRHRSTSMLEVYDGRRLDELTRPIAERATKGWKFIPR